MFKFTVENNNIVKYSEEGFPTNFTSMKALIVFYNIKTHVSSVSDMTTQMFNDLLFWNHVEQLPAGKSLNHQIPHHENDDVSVVVSYRSNHFEDLVKYVKEYMPFVLKNNKLSITNHTSHNPHTPHIINPRVLFYNHETKLSYVVRLTSSMFNDLLYWYNMCDDDSNKEIPIGQSLNHEFEDHEGDMASIIV